MSLGASSLFYEFVSTSSKTGDTKCGGPVYRNTDTSADRKYFISACYITAHMCKNEKMTEHLVLTTMSVHNVGAHPSLFVF